jgi:hypothetical protein
LRIIRTSRARFGDILRVNTIDQEKARAVLVSLFRSYYEGCYYADSFGVAVDELPDGAAVGRHLKVTATGLEWVEMTPAILYRTKVALQALSRVRDDPEDSEEQRIERRKERNRLFVSLLQKPSKEDQP